MSKIIKYAEQKHIPANQLYVDHGYQRPRNTKQISDIAENFNPQMARPVMVVKNDKLRKYEIFEGQHTWEAWVRVHGATVPVPCQIVDCEDAALKFLQANTYSRSVSSADKFRALLHSKKDKAATGVERAAKKYGMTLRINKAGRCANHEFQQQSLWPLYLFCQRHGFTTLCMMIKMLTVCFSRPDGENIENDTKSAAFIGALAVVYSSRFEPEDIFYALKGWKLSAADLRAKGRELGGQGGRSDASAIASIILRRIKSKVE